MPQSSLGDVVFVDLPAVGKTVEKGKEAAVVESVKAASDVYAPIDGEIVEVNKSHRRRTVAGEQRSGRWRVVHENQDRQPGTT